MTTKEWLRRGLSLNDELRVLEGLKRQSYNMACSATNSIGDDRVQTSRSNSAERKMLVYADYSQQVDNKIAELLSYRSILLNRINLLENPTHRIILIARYVEGSTWVDIADKTNYSLRAVYKIHNQALKALEMTADEKEYTQK